jgi:hypothetical protein
MKKVALILLICIYSMSTFGIGIRQFYCCGRLKSTNITFLQQELKEKCGKGGTTDGCCQAKYKSLKVKDSHIAADGVITPSKYFTDLYSYTPSFEVLTLANQPKVVANAIHAPPSTPGIYIFHCTYRI